MRALLFPLALSTCAIIETRSYGPGGQRYGLGGAIITTIPPSGTASSCRLSSWVCGPGFQACGSVSEAASE